MKDYGLTNRESEVANLLVTGLNANEIGGKLYITEKAVKFHLQKIYKKLGVKNNVNAVLVLLGLKDVKKEKPAEEPAPAPYDLPTPGVPSF